ncbi:MAG: hypothetical protein IPK82_18810 [Polyangiaceae bacterium]|nr:hypothetical protein [Polyangiaceae bacterium]
MKTFYTWRDVEHELNRTGNAPWYGVSADNQSLVIHTPEERQSACLDLLNKLLKARFTTEEDGSHAVELASPPGQRRNLTIVFQDEPPYPSRRRQRPLWAEVDHPRMELSPFPAGSPSIAAFYSFKGGVGRTTTLLATLGALLGRKRPAKVLVVDADLEAPGLTLQIPGPTNRFTLLNFLGLVHDADDWRRDALPIAQDQLGPPLSWELNAGRREFYFLPSFDLRELPDEPNEPAGDDALFVREILPEHLVRRPGRAYIIADALVALGARLGIDTILVDLRAGVSELASPLLLDPRVKRVLVTACNYQSFEGTRHVLRRLRSTPTINMAQLSSSNDPQLQLFDRTTTRATPTEVVLTMIQDGQDVSEKVGILQREVVPENENDATLDLVAPNIHEVPFAQELLEFDSVENLLNLKLPGTSLGKQTAREIAASLVLEQVEKAVSETTATLKSVADFASQLEYAEANTLQNMLPTKPLKDLVEAAKEGLPAAVVLGAKGAGKTYAWGQLVMAGSWRTFAAQVVPNGNRPNALVFPLLSPLHLNANLAARVGEAEENVRDSLGTRGSSIMTGRELSAALRDPEKGVDGLDFWIQGISTRLGFNVGNLTDLHSELARRGRSLCLVVDGLEDAFQLGPGEKLHPKPRTRLFALLSDLTVAIRELRSSHLGIVTFVRRDIAQQAIVQNFGQFASNYERFALHWTATEAMRLVAWILNQTQFIRFSDLNNEPYESLREALIPFWGERMGSPGSNEAYTDRWVIAALSDYQGRLQARDLVRLVANGTRESARKELQRVNATSLRDALEECSKKKIEELIQETPGLEKLLNRLRNADEDLRKMPFQAEAFQLSNDDVKFLEDQGVVKSGDHAELFLPEIIRHGLNFKLSGGRRPAVLKLFRDAQKRGRA